ncbi:BTAD domain-containing putative transcriptional regulator [Kribbella sp. NPDC056861]|uniref:AfsR/SARP family transcriptional regulator n=1 Tax=Kribbella sp. NPDC056861 TaxID=3154857 RepID=UPI00343F351D
MNGLEVGVLGPLVVLRDGQPIAVSSDRLRALLAVLAISAGRFVSVDTIGAAVWGTDPPVSVRRSVQTCVTRLRRLIGAESIVTAPDGYILAIEPDNVDALRLLRWTNSEPGDPTSAAEILALWRGQPFEGIRPDWLAQTESARLVEHYLTVAEQLIDQLIDAGQLPAATIRLRELTTRHPLREPLWARLLIALDRSGRQAEALESYETIRSTLAGELGVDPGPELQRLYAELLVDDHSPIASVRVPQQLPSGTVCFTGRHEALAALTRLLPSAQRARPIVVAGVHGAGGVGKTALAVHWAHLVRDRFPDGQLFLDLRGYGPGAPMTPGAALDLLLSGLGVPVDQIPASIDARSTLLRTHLADRRMLIVLDNALNAGQVRPLLPGSSSLVLVTSRNRLRGLVVHHDAHQIGLDALRPAESIELIERLMPTSATADGEAGPAELAELCGHLPLALRIAASHHDRDRPNQVPALLTELREEQSRLDALQFDDESAGIRAVFSWSYRALDPASAQLFRLLGTLPTPDITPPAAAALAGITPSEARRLMNRLVEAHLLEERRPDRYEQHDLLRLYAGELAEEHDAAGRDSAVRRLFSFYIYSARAGRRKLGSGRGEPSAPLDPLLDSVVPLDFDDDRQAMAWFDSVRPVALPAIQLAISMGLDRTGYELSQMLSIGSLFRRDYHHVRRIHELGLACARRTADSLVEANSAQSVGTAWWHLGDNHRAIEHFEQAARLFGQEGSLQGSADVLEMAATCHYDLGQYDQAVDQLEQSVELIRRLPTDETEARKLNTLAMVYLWVGRPEDALTAGQRALELCGRSTHRLLESYVWDTIGQAQTHLRHFDDASRSYQQGIDLARDLDDQPHLAEIHANLAKSQQAAGRLDQARINIRSALQILRRLDIEETDDISRSELLAVLAGLDQVSSSHRPQ